MRLDTFDAFAHLSVPKGCHRVTDDELKQLQAVLMDILLDVRDFCAAHGLRFCITGGSALGVARHRGIIPWDDDIDILMPRADFDRFMTLFAIEMGDRYTVQVPGKTPGYPLLFGRVRRKGTSVQTRDDIMNRECGAYLDIFIAENAPGNPLLRGLHGVGALALGFLVSCRKFRRDRATLLRMAEGAPELRKQIRVKSAIGLCVSFLSLERWAGLADRWHRLYRNGNSRLIVIPSGRKKYFHELFPRDAVCEYQPLPFNGEIMPCMAKLDDYLKLIYGDYSVIPPETEREAHVYLEPFEPGKPWRAADAAAEKESTP